MLSAGWSNKVNDESAASWFHIIVQPNSGHAKHLRNCTRLQRYKCLIYTRAAGSPGPLTWMGGNIAQSTTYTYDISTGHIKLPNSLLARVTVQILHLHIKDQAEVILTCFNLLCTTLDLQHALYFGRTQSCIYNFTCCCMEYLNIDRAVTCSAKIPKSVSNATSTMMQHSMVRILNPCQLRWRSPAVTKPAKMVMQHWM